MKQKIMLMSVLFYFVNFMFPQAVDKNEPVTIVQDVEYLLTANAQSLALFMRLTGEMKLKT